MGTRDTRDGDAELGDISSRMPCVVDLAGDADMTLLYSQPDWRQMVVDLLGSTPKEAPRTYCKRRPGQPRGQPALSESARRQPRRADRASATRRLGATLPR